MSNRLICRNIYLDCSSNKAIAGNVFGVKPKTQLEIMHDTLGEIYDRKGVPISNVGSSLGKLKKECFVRVSDGKVNLTAKGEKFLRKYKTIKRFTGDFRL